MRTSILMPFTHTQKCTSTINAVFPYARDSIINIPKDEIQFLVFNDTLLDFLLMKIRSKLIAYATMKKKRKTFRN